MKRCGIYKITNQINGKFYVGCSIDIEQRWADHKSPRAMRRSHLLARAFKKYGKDNFLFEILEECAAPILFDREIAWIAQLKPAYNMNSGGLGNKGRNQSFATKQKLAVHGRAQWERMTPEEQRKRVENNLIGARVIGRVLPESQKLKMRRPTQLNLLRNRPYRSTAARWTRVAAIELDWSGFELFESLQQAGHAYNIRPCSISDCASGRQKTAAGKLWQRVPKSTPEPLFLLTK